MSYDMYVPALPEIAQSFGVSDNLITLTLTTYLFGAVVMQMIAGPLSDHFGRRPILFFGGILFVLVTIACALAPNVIILILARFFQGALVSSMVVAGYAAIHELYVDNQLMRILGLMGSAAFFAPLLGPVIGGYLLTYINWHWIFGAVALLAAVSLCFLWFLMPETLRVPHPEAHRPRHFWQAYRQLVHSPLFLKRAACLGFGYGALVVWVSASSFLLIEQGGLSFKEFGLVQLSFFAAYLFGAAIIKQFLPHVIKRHIVFWGLALSALSALLALFFSWYLPENWWGLALPIAAYSFGFGLAAAPLQRRAVIASPLYKGVVLAALYLITMAIAGLGTLSVAFLYDASFFSETLVIATFALIAFLLYFFTHVAKQEAHV